MSILHVSGLWSLNRDVIRSLADWVRRMALRMEALVITGISRTGADFSHACYLVHLLQKNLDLAPSQVLILPAGGDLVARTRFNHECHLPIMRRSYRADQPTILAMKQGFIAAWDTEALWCDTHAWHLCGQQVMDLCQAQGRAGLLISNRAIECWRPDAARLIGGGLQELTCDPACPGGQSSEERHRICTPAGSMTLLGHRLGAPPFENARLLTLSATDLRPDPTGQTPGPGGGAWPNPSRNWPRWSESLRRWSAHSERLRLKKEPRA